MTDPALEQRVLVLARTGRDAAVTCRLLEARGFGCMICGSLDELGDELGCGAACAVITIESLAGSRAKLEAVLAAQPAWSDFPFVILTAGPLPDTSVLAWLGKVFVIDRPIMVNALVTMLRSALRARIRQYEARAAIEQRDQFLAMLGHELRNPLGAILLASEVGATPATPDQLASRMEVVRRQSKHLARLVDDLLDVARVTSGKIALRPSSVDVVDIVTACIASLVRYASDRQVEVMFAPPPRFQLEADATRLGQIVDN
ncbi:MAG TPA: HAMP domain-containing sensor histidine kinase, partial [Kofleriaceae bacterium]